MSLSKQFDVSVATKLLRDPNLFWSSDFEVIRLPLADLIESMANALEAAQEVMASVSSEYEAELPVCKCGGKCGKVC